MSQDFIGVANQVFISTQENQEFPQWISKVHSFVLEALKALEIKDWELSVLFCKDDFISELNNQYRQINAPTDVLSFELGEKYVDDSGREWFSAGDIAISVDTLFNNAKEFSVSPDEELKRLLVHGILHLAGHDHSDNSPEQEMLKLQETILSGLLKTTDTIIDE